MGYQLVCNFQARELVPFADLPEKVRAEFDYVSEEDWSNRFVCYRGEWFDVFDCQRIVSTSDKFGYAGWSMPVHPGEPFAHFDAIQSDSYFSGHVFKLCADDTVIVARYYS
jgi:hypothetical protein